MKMEKSKFLYIRKPKNFKIVYYLKIHLLFFLIINNLFLSNLNAHALSSESYYFFIGPAIHFNFSSEKIGLFSISFEASYWDLKVLRVPIGYDLGIEYFFKSKKALFYSEIQSLLIPPIGVSLGQFIIFNDYDFKIEDDGPQISIWTGLIGLIDYRYRYFIINKNSINSLGLMLKFPVYYNHYLDSFYYIVRN